MTQFVQEDRGGIGPPLRHGLRPALGAGIEPQLVEKVGRVERDLDVRQITVGVRAGAELMGHALFVDVVAAHVEQEARCHRAACCPRDAVIDDNADVVIGRADKVHSPLVEGRADLRLDRVIQAGGNPLRIFEANGVSEVGRVGRCKAERACRKECSDGPDGLDRGAAVKA
jgi:hypothetical protein